MKEQLPRSEALKVIRRAGRAIFEGERQLRTMHFWLGWNVACFLAFAFDQNFWAATVMGAFSIHVTYRVSSLQDQVDALKKEILEI